MKNFLKGCMGIKDGKHYFIHLAFINMYSDLIAENGIEGTELTRSELEEKLIETFNEGISCLKDLTELKIAKDIKNYVFQQEHLEEAINLKIATNHLSFKDGKYNLTDKGIGLAMCKSV